MNGTGRRMDREGQVLPARSAAGSDANDSRRPRRALPASPVVEVRARGAGAAAPGEPVLRMERDLLSRAAAFFAQENVLPPAVTFAFIEGGEGQQPEVVDHCGVPRLRRVARVGFYEWRRAQAKPCARRRADAELAARSSRSTASRVAPTAHRGPCGAPAGARDVRVGRKRVERLMRAQGLQGVTRRRRRGPTRRDAAAVPNDDLVARQFRPTGPNQLWVADITEHPTDEGKVYLRGGDRRLEPPGRRPLDRRSSPRRARRRRAGDGVLAATPRRRSDRASLRPRHPIHLLGVRSAAPRTRACSARWAPSATRSTTRSPRASSRTLQTELLDRRRLGHAGPARASDLRMDRGLLQPATPALDPRDAQPPSPTQTPQRSTAA